MDLYYKVNNNKYSNIKEILRDEFNVSSRLYSKLKTNKRIYLNGNNLIFNDTISLDDIVEVDLCFDEDSENIKSSKMDLDIIYEDNYLLVLNKPAGLPVHPSMRHFEDTLSNGVKAYFESLNLHRKIRAVNRLDKDTSGIVVFAKCEYVQESLNTQMKNKIFKKEYIGILSGALDKPSGTIDAPIARKTESIIERQIDKNGQNAITHFELIKSSKDMSLVKFVLETGRTHQIRVHSKYIGHPIVRRYSISALPLPLFQGRLFTHIKFHLFIL